MPKGTRNPATGLTKNANHNVVTRQEIHDFYKISAAALNCTVRDLVDEAMTTYAPKIMKLVKKHEPSLEPVLVAAQEVMDELAEKRRAGNEALTE